MVLALLSASLIAAAPVHLLDRAPEAFAAQAPSPLPAPPDANDPNAITWYGWEPLVADATGTALFFGGLALGNNQSLVAAEITLSIAGICVYVGGGPLLHWARGRSKTALIDLGLRVGLPVGGVLAGLALGGLTGGSGIFIPFFFVLGLVAAVVTDLVGLSWDSPEDRPEPGPMALRWAPFIGAARGSPVAGVAGTF